ncbi:hypothetical protein LEP1GSC170_2734 [Leptospira interrogans serovar Bataviae str. HAI135]|nr:hypothetical protein LEP1GSC170_2734 [Leptospira interrogans serovar Bataviae str. HAI135]
MVAWDLDSKNRKDRKVKFKSELIPNLKMWELLRKFNDNRTARNLPNATNL